MQETLQDRLQQEVREKYSRAIAKNAMGYEELEDIVSHTIAETIKAGVSVIEGEKMETPDNALAQYAEREKMGFNAGLKTAVTKLQELGQPTEVISDKIK